MKKIPSPLTISITKAKILIVCALLASAAASALADIVVVSSKNATGKNPDPPYLEANGSWIESTLKSSAANTDSGRAGSRFNSSGEPAITVTPTLAVAGGVYLVELTHGSASSISTDIIMAISSPDGSCDVSTNLTTGFRQNQGVNTWVFACYITNHVNVTAPQLTFAYSSGTVGPTQAANRVYSDSVRFSLATDPCLAGLPQLNAINGPLASGQTFVNVPGVDSTATDVSVYANGIKIGQKSSGIVSNVNVVTVSALVKGQLIAATQSKAGVESCLGVGGSKVGGGASPRIRVSASLRQDPAAAGPIGADGGTGSPNIYFLGATGPAAGFGTAPQGGRVISPSTNGWQTVSFTNGVDPSYIWAGAGIVPDANPFGVLEGLALCIDDLTDSGPYNVYIDNIMNGTNVISDFETPNSGAVAYMFTQPSFSSTTSPFLLAPAPGVISPNVSVITTNNADTGTNCLQATWQFKDTAAADWLRFAALGSGPKNPMIDLTQPFSFRILVLPVGVTNTDLNISLVPNRTNSVGTSSTFTVAAHGTGPFTYQWQTNGVSISGATLSSYTKNSLTLSDSARYTVLVNNTHASTSTSSLLTVSDAVVPVAMTISFDGTQATLNWVGSHTLQSSTDATGVTVPYADVSGPVLTGPYPVTPSGTAVFYRLKN